MNTSSSVASRPVGERGAFQTNHLESLTLPSRYVAGHWTGIPEVGFALTESGRETILGGRLLEARGAGLVFGLDVEGRRHESSVDDLGAEHRIGLGFGWRLEGARREDLEFHVEVLPESRIGLRLTVRW